MSTAAPTPTGAHWRRVSLLAALGTLWTACWLGGAFLLATSPGNRTHGESRFLLDTLARTLHLRTPPDALAAPWFAEALLFVVLGTFLVAMLATLFDRERYSSRALHWSLRTLPCLLAWQAITLACAWLVSLTPLSEQVGIFIPAALILWPFVFLRADVIASDRPPLFWLPAWSGLPAIAIAILAILAMFGLNVVLDGLVERVSRNAAWAQMPAGLVEWALELALTVYVLSAWQQRCDWNRVGRGVPTRSLLVGVRTLLALELQWFWLTVLLFVPVILCIPVLIDNVATQLQHVPQAQAGASSARRLSAEPFEFFARYWWLGLIAVAGALQYWLQFAAKARALWIAEAKGNAGHA